MDFVEVFSVDFAGAFSVLLEPAFSEAAGVDVLDFSAAGVVLDVDDDSLGDDSDFVACLRASDG